MMNDATLRAVRPTTGATTTTTPSQPDRPDAATRDRPERPEKPEPSTAGTPSGRKRRSRAKAGPKTKNQYGNQSKIVSQHQPLPDTFLGFVRLNRTRETSEMYATRLRPLLRVWNPLNFTPRADSSHYAS